MARAKWKDSAWNKEYERNKKEQKKFGTLYNRELKKLTDKYDKTHKVRESTRGERNLYDLERQSSRAYKTAFDAWSKALHSGDEKAIKHWARRKNIVLGITDSYRDSIKRLHGVKTGAADNGDYQSAQRRIYHGESASDVKDLAKGAAKFEYLKGLSSAPQSVYTDEFENDKEKAKYGLSRYTFANASAQRSVVDADSFRAALGNRSISKEAAQRAYRPSEERMREEDRALFSFARATVSARGAIQG